MVHTDLPPWARPTNTTPATKPQPRAPFLWKLANYYTLLFTALSLTGHIDWPLWLILLPVLIAIGVMFIYGFTKGAIQGVAEARAK